jgi:hypothetical protein
MTKNNNKTKRAGASQNVTRIPTNQQPGASEQDITRAIRAVLTAHGIWHFKHFSGGFVGRKGVADILGILPGGKFLAVEVKKPGGRVSPEQADFLQEVNAAGGVGFIAYSSQDVITRLRLADLFTGKS